jgi:hypothetical protein
MKIGDLVKIRYSRGQGNMGIIATAPRFGVNVLAPDGTTGKKVCEVYFMASAQIALRACTDLEVINESR